MSKFDDLQFKDDFMFGAVMSNPEICKGILELILNVKIKKIKYIERQKSIDVAPFSKGIRLDIYLADEEETVYSVEMQRKHIKGLPKRVRYYQDINDISLMEQG
ncbi:MAG: PD-(D/E)XK nuclease family transposase, partial [Anaerovoracaceae bacterium]